ncbi:uncharacterized protein LOC133311711 [Gastrolobium bilobum]|uniref:uncharacterized protein LOC133311711 n=1 Tax=Gastrolobium bilobum TaxID=150636 RepID=UPI002AAF9140|nr:uncharacterized protein LOC133311711 [Gastrolobium bilobum]
MVAWAVELSEFGIIFEARKAIKAQTLADFVVEMTHPRSDLENSWWKLFVDGSSNMRGSGVGIIIENPEGVAVEHSLTLEFPTSNNQAEYEAMIAGLIYAKELGAEYLVVYSDSQLATSQVSGVYQARGEIMIKYLSKVQELIGQFKEVRVEHIRRNDNIRVDVLSKLASTKTTRSLRTIIQQSVEAPSVVWMIQEVDWRSPIQDFLEKGKELGDQREAVKLRRRATWFVIIEGQLYRRGMKSPLLKCIAAPNTEYVLEEIHEGITGHHLGGKSLARKAIRAGYFWTTIGEDAKKHVRRCEQCKKFSSIYKAPTEELFIISSPWPFFKWGMDLLGPFPKAAGGVKYLIVAADYFTKWIEAEPLATITARKVQKFFISKIVCRFGIPAIVITDNGTQFMDKKFGIVGVKHKFSTVEHP